MDPVELGEPDKVPAVYRAERAVIEAAAKLVDGTSRLKWYPNLDELREAVEAMQAAREKP